MEIDWENSSGACVHALAQKAKHLGPASSTPSY